MAGLCVVPSEHVSPPSPGEADVWLLVSGWTAGGAVVSVA